MPQIQTQNKENLEGKLARPLQALVIADSNDRKVVLDGSKKIIIERDWIDYIKCFAVLCCPEFCIGVNIKNVRHCLAEEITEEEYKDHGFNNYQNMIQGMRKYYSNFNDKTKVTITRWDDLDYGIIE